MDVAVAALVVTKLVDTFRNMFDPGGTAPRWTWNLAALVIGTALSFVWELSFFDAVTDAQGIVGQILTGLGLGAGAGAWHELLDLFSSKAKDLHSRATGV